jgi:hypothetical protein
VQEGYNLQQMWDKTFSGEVKERGKKKKRKRKKKPNKAITINEESKC